MTEALLGARDKSWQWFERHARGPFALPLLALMAFADGIFLPIAPEVFLVALMVAHPGQWRRFLPVALVSSALGGAVGYLVARFLFAQFGLPLLHFYHLENAFMHIQHTIRGHVFLTMALGNFVPLPDKVLIYAGGFLGVRFLPFITGYFVGRGVRMSIVCYLTERYGKHFIEVAERYFLVGGLVLLALATIYGMVHWHLLPL